MEPSNPSREKENIPHKDEKESEPQILNRRTNNRYFIHPISVGTLGSIVEISKGSYENKKDEQ